MSVASLRSKDLLGIESLSPEEIVLILDTAEAMRSIGQRPIKKVPALRGKMVVNLFFESSTRTRFSFETAEKWLSADGLSFAAKGSSVEKGESLLDTARTLQAMSPDLIVIRHACPGVPHFLARNLKAGVVNAGDGAHEHPTQALLDALTIRRRFGGLEGLRVEEWRRGEIFCPSLRLDETTIIDLLQADRTGQNVDHVCLVIEPTDLDTIAASGRFDVVSGPDRRWGARGDGNSLYVLDPDGNVVELRHYS